MKCLIAVACLFYSVSGASQTYDEWFRQKKTQRKYLLQQITALKVYAGYVEKGYEVVSGGLNLINDITNGDFRLHDDYFQSLQHVNPRIKEYRKVAEIVKMQIGIVKRTKECLRALQELRQVTDTELKHAELVVDNLVADCLQCIDELYLLVTSGQVNMKDDERLRRINALYSDMQDKVAFCHSYTEEVTLLAVQRIRESYEIKLSRTLNDIP